MTAPNPGLADLIAAAVRKHRAGAAMVLKRDTYCGCGASVALEDHPAHVAAHVALEVEQHTNGRIAEAKQWDGTRASIEEIAQWANANDDPMDDFTLQYCFMSTKPDDVFDARIWSENDYKTVTPGDWIIRDTAGEFHLCRTVRAALEGEQR